MNCPRRRHENRPGAKFCEECGQAVGAATPADRDPEEARKLLDPVLELMMEAVHRYEGTVNQVMGDGIMALFGAPPRGGGPPRQEVQGSDPGRQRRLRQRGHPKRREATLHRIQQLIHDKVIVAPVWLNAGYRRSFFSD